MTVKRNKAVFLDRDGTLIHEAHYLRDPKKVRLYKDVASSLHQLKKAGYKLILVTNQSVIGRGITSHRVVRAVNRKVQDLIHGLARIRFDAMYYCPHRPSDQCPCRKPNIGFARQAKKRFGLNLQKSFFIGDKLCDMGFARRIGAAGILVRTGYGSRALREARRGSRRQRPHQVAWRFKEAAAWILRQNHCS